MIDICLPGTSGMVPRHDRYLSCCYLFYNGSATLIDCGEGTQIALLKTHCKLSRLDRILITHYHADHVAGLPGLLLSIGNTSKRTPLTIAGPAGLIEVVSSLRIIAPVLPYLVNLVVLGNDKTSLSWDNVRIDTVALDHGIPCLGYRFSVFRKPIFNPEKAQNLNVPIELYKTLHEGTTITLPNGQTITPDMVTDGPRPPIRICYVTDTRMVPSLIPFAHNADLLISEGMYGDESMRQKANEHLHMLFSDSARLARSANAKRLWLTHYSPSLEYPDDYLPLARKIFSNTEAAHDGMRTTL